MFKNKPVTLLIAAGLLIALIVLAGLLPLFARSTGMGFPGGRQNGQGNFDPGSMPESFTPPSSEDGSGAPSKPDGVTPPEGFTPGEGSMPEGALNGRTGTSSMSMKLMQLLRGLQIGGGILVAISGIAAILGIMLSKKWGVVFAVMASILAILVTLPNFFQRFFGSSLVESLIKIIIAASIIVLCFLPRSRKAEPAA